MAKRKIPTLNETLPRLVPGQFLAIMRDIEALKNGEFFIYGGTYNERKTVQGEELGRCFAYQEELHIADEDGVEKLDNVLRKIAGLLDYKVWRPETLEEIAAILRENDYPVRDPENETDEHNKEAAVAAALRAVAKSIR